MPDITDVVIDIPLGNAGSVKQLLAFETVNSIS